jgi:CDP-diacylglycerol--serine O-phosphatidyltransferase
MSETEEIKVEHKGLKKGLYLIPSLFTAGNIAMGFLAVISSARGFRLIDNPESAAIYFDYAAKAIGLAILFDTLDGRLARMTKTETEIGVQLDSLADVLTFGIAPTVLAYAWAVGATFNDETSIHSVGVFILFMYLMCGTFRLARFNLAALRPRVLAEGTSKVDKKNFVGLPIPPSAGLIASIVHFKPMPLNSYGENLGNVYSVLMLLLIAILGLLMVSTLRYSSFKSAGSDRKSIYLILFVAAIFMAIWLYSKYVLLSLAIVYVGHGIIWYLFSLFKRSKQVEES